MTGINKTQFILIVSVVLFAALLIVGIWGYTFLDLSSLDIGFDHEDTMTTADTSTIETTVETTAQTTTVTETSASTAETSSAEETTYPPVVVPTPDKRIALTFDDGPSSVYTAEILDILDKYNAKATFFVVGYQLSSSKGEILSRMVAEGHEIGNHSDTHPSSLTELSAEELASQIKNVNEAISRLTNGYECTLLRPPGGNINRETLDRIYAADIRMHTILWDSDTRDWEFNAKVNSGEMTEEEAIEQAMAMALSTARDGSIMLMHDIKEITPALLEALLDTLSKNGYEFVTVSELFDFESKGEDAYFSKFYSEYVVTPLR